LFIAGADGLQSIAITGPAGVKAIYDQGNGVPAQEGVVYDDALSTDAAGNVTLIGRGSVTGDEAFRLTIHADGSYEFSQSSALVHPLFDPANEDDLPLAFNFTVTDKDGDKDSGTLTVTVDDDTPVAGDVTKSGDEDAGQFNLMFIVDNSSSMGRDPGVAGFTTKLDVAKQAIIDAIDKYDAVGDVMVRLVTFNSVGQEIGSTWMSVADAKAALAGISVSNSSTNFEAALAAAQGAYTDSGKISSPDVKNVSFFLSDGNPNPDSAGIDTPAEEAAWKAFLTTNAITSHALGIGTDIEIGNLDPIAYDGATNSDEDGIVVSDLNDLSEVLSGFAEQTLATGNLFTGVAAAASFGADGGTAGLVATGAPNGFTYELSGGKLLVKQGGDTVLTVSLNPTTGAYEIKQSALISHDPAVTSQLFNFTHKLTDGDGDSASGHIAFTLTYDQPVSISGLTPKANGGDATVDEANLADGSAPNAGALTQTGTFTIKADDGIDFLKVGGVSVISGGVFTAQTITTPLGNTLKITAYDSATGVVTYTYTLNDNEQHPAGSAPLFEDFQVQLQDVDGSAASDTLTIRILDDVATAVNDTDSVKEDGPTVATGNVITDAEGDGGKDTAGADGVSIAWSGASGSTVNGTYGTLTVGANGSYSYSLNNNNTAVQGLSANEHLTETFTYTITDSDGDSSTATLTITINGTDDEAGIYGIGNAAGDEVVDEDDLPDGSSPNAAALTQTGTFTIEAKDGYDDLTVGGTAILNNGVVQNLNTPIATTYGQLTITGINLITGVVSYSYVLSDNTTAHPAPGQDSLFDNIAVTLTDVDGSSANSTLIVKVVDDVATASNDADSVKEDGPLTADGNVLTGSGGSDANNTDGVADIAGADGVTIAWAGVSGSSVQGTHGVLTVGADGSYSYALDNNGAAVQGLSASEHLTEIFTYTITDGDGDTSTATLTITINGTDDGVTITGIGSAAGDEVVDEDDLADGSSPNAAALTQTGTFTIEAKDGYDDLTVGGTPIINNGAIQNLNTAISTAYGTLKITGVNLITGVVSYSYVLSDNTTAHPAAGQDSLFDNISVTLTDTDGSSASSTLIVKVIDDVSTANNDTIAQGGENSAITFNAFSNDVFGADGVDIDNSPSVAVTFTAAGKGTVGYNAATGLFTYTPNAGAEGSDSFTYTIKDGDGDTSTATVTVNLSADSKPVIGSLSLVADEDNLATGNHDVVTGDDAQSNLTGNLPISTGNDAIASISFAGMNGTLASFTSKGQPVHYSWNAASNTLIAYTGANPATVANQVFTFQVTNVATGAYVMTLLAAVDQHAVNAADNTETANVSFNLNYVVTDSDGSTGNGTIGVTIDDDVPVAFYPESVFIENVAQGPVTNALNFAQGVGGDGLGDVNFNITNGQAMTDANGNNVQLNGEQVYLHYGSDHHTVIGQTADGDSAFTAILDPANNSYTFDLDGTLYNVAQTSFVNVSGVGGGNVQYKGLGIGTADSHDILISGNGSVNTNATEIGIDGGNDISAGDIARFDMVKNLAVGGANGTGFVHDGHYEVANYIQQVSWVQGGGSNTAGFTVTIRNGDNDFTYLGDATGEGHAGNITVKVFNTDPSIGSPVPVATFTDSDNNVVVTGVKQGQYIEISSTDPFAIVEYSNQTGKSFKLGSINVESANTLDPFDTSLSVTGTDADGDAVNSSINIHLNPDARTQQGDGGNNTLTGTDAVKDILIGMDGDDQLTGAGGDDILAGGSGANTITGGAGNDTIFFDASAFDAADKITDYVAGQDAIDLSDLFTVDTAGGQTLNNYVQMSGTNLQVDANGSTGGSNFTTIATLNTSSPVSIVYHDDTHTTDQTGTA
jgi:T1SS-143 domain-containing protein